MVLGCPQPTLGVPSWRWGPGWHWGPHLVLGILAKAGSSLTLLQVPSWSSGLQWVLGFCDHPWGPFWEGECPTCPVPRQGVTATPVSHR